jgi:hypothetical protein
MEVITDPVPHIIANLNPKIYDYCKSVWVSGPTSNNELRYNTLIHDGLIRTYVDGVAREAYDLLLPYLRKTYPTWVPKDLSIRSQFAGNLKSDRAYRMRDWHLDNGNKVVIGLWYFKHPDDSDEGGLHISDGIHEKLIPYQENTVVFLPNLPNAWHKVGDRSIWTHERRFINIVVEQDQVLHDYLRSPDGVDRVRAVKNLMI